MRSIVRVSNRILTGALALVAMSAAPVEALAPQVRETVVEAGSLFVHALCTSGAPEVLLLHDEGRSAASFLPVLERLEGRVGACAYDRPNFGGEGSSERGWLELAEETTTIRGALGFGPRSLIVGHGLGGLYARLLASRRPGGVGGLLLIDPAHEDMLIHARAGMPAEAARVREAAAERINEDGLRVNEAYRHARATQLPDIPVTVVTAMRSDGEDGWDERFLTEAARRAHASIVRGLTFGRHVPARDVGHDLPSEAPDLVVEELLRLHRIIDRIPPGTK